MALPPRSMRWSRLGVRCRLAAGHCVVLTAALCAHNSVTFPGRARRQSSLTGCRVSCLHPPASITRVRTPARSRIAQSGPNAARGCRPRSRRCLHRGARIMVLPRRASRGLDRCPGDRPSRRNCYRQSFSASTRRTCNRGQLRDNDCKSMLLGSKLKGCYSMP